MASIKQIIPAEPGWEGIYVREDATWESPVKSAAAPIVGWALVDDENGESAVHALLNVGGFVAPAIDLDTRYLGAVRAGDWAARLIDHWEALAQAHLEEYGEPGAAGEEGGEGAEGEGEAGAAAPEVKAG